MKRVLSWLVYPGFVASAVLVVHLGIVRGLPAVAVLGAVQLAAITAIALLERWMPEHEAWNVPRGDLRVDALYLVVSGVIVTSLVRAAVFYGAPSLGLWPARWPFALQVVAAVALTDLASYSSHVLEHRTRALWPVHAPHHSAQRLYWLNATRMHPLDQGGTVLLSLLPLALLGAPPDVLALFDAFAIVHLLLQHSNVRLRHGALSQVLATAEFHRWHHSTTRAESECNYASFLSLWDQVFRTFRMPRVESTPAEIGLYADTAPLPAGFLAQLRSPFTAWRALLRGR